MEREEQAVDLSDRARAASRAAISRKVQKHAGSRRPRGTAHALTVGTSRRRPSARARSRSHRTSAFFRNRFVSCRPLATAISADFDVGGRESRRASCTFGEARSSPARCARRRDWPCVPSLDQSKDLQHPHRVAGDLRASGKGRASARPSMPARQLALGLAEAADSGEVMPVGIVLHEPQSVFVRAAAAAKRPGRSSPTRGSDSRSRRPPRTRSRPSCGSARRPGGVARVGGEADVRQAQVVRVAVRPCAQSSTSAPIFCCLQVQDDAVFMSRRARPLRCAGSRRPDRVAGDRRARRDDLVVEEREQLVARVDEVHLHAEVAEDRRTRNRRRPARRS